MSETTVIALVILVGVFSIMIATVIKGGHEAAIKMWGVMGALTGVAFGSITSFYFTKEKFQNEIVDLKSQETLLHSALRTASNNAEDVDERLQNFKAALSGQLVTDHSYLTPVAYKISEIIPESEKHFLIEELGKDSKKLQSIQSAEMSIKRDTWTQ